MKAREELTWDLGMGTGTKGRRENSYAPKQALQAPSRIREPEDGIKIQDGKKKKQ